MIKSQKLYFWLKNPNIIRDYISINYLLFDNNKQ